VVAAAGGGVIRRRLSVSDASGHGICDWHRSAVLARRRADVHGHGVRHGERGRGQTAAAR
jgi:hypothetical protein